MTLDQYLAIEGNTAAALADKANTTGPTIHRLLYGDQQPSAEMIRAIVEATKGKVTAQDLIFGKPRERPEKAA